MNHGIMAINPGNPGILAMNHCPEQANALSSFKVKSNRPSPTVQPPTLFVTFRGATGAGSKASNGSLSKSESQWTSGASSGASASAVAAVIELNDHQFSSWRSCYTATVTPTPTAYCLLFLLDAKNKRVLHKQLTTFIHPVNRVNQSISQSKVKQSDSQSIIHSSINQSESSQSCFQGPNSHGKELSHPAHCPWLHFRWHLLPAGSLQPESSSVCLSVCQSIHSQSQRRVRVRDVSVRELRVV